MAGSWGADAPVPDLWASLHTVVNAEFAELEPLFERFDLKQLQEFEKKVHLSITRQFNAGREGGTQAAASSGGAPATTSTSASSAPPGGASAATSTPASSLPPGKQIAASAQPKQSGSPGPSFPKAAQRSPEAARLAKADPPPLPGAPVSKKAVAAAAKAATGGPVAPPPPKVAPKDTVVAKPVVPLKATPKQMEALFAGDLVPQTAEDAIGLLRAAHNAAVASFVPVPTTVNLEEMDGEEFAEPPLPPPPTPPTKAMPLTQAWVARETPAPDPAAVDDEGDADAGAPPVAQDPTDAAGPAAGDPQPEGSSQASSTTPPPKSTFLSSSQPRQQRRRGPRPAVDYPNLEAALQGGPPGPVLCGQFAPLGLPAPWPQADVDDGTVFRDEPPPYTATVSVCAVRCPSCWIRKCPRRNSSGYRKPHEHHLCVPCHENAKRLSSTRT